MNHRLITLALLAFGSAALGACTEEKRVAPASAATPTAAAPTTQPTGDQPRTDEKSPSPASTAVQATPAQTPAAASAKAAQAAATNPANARHEPKRYEGGIEKLDSKYDLSKVKVPEAQTAATTPAAGAEHAPGAPAQGQDGSQLLPNAQAERNKGHIALKEGENQVQDLGKLRQGEIAGHDFQMVSDGEEPLIITGVKPSCGCTKADIAILGEQGEKKTYTKGDPIAPGTKFVLETEINTDGKPQGPFNAQVSIYGNDLRGAFNVRLTAEVEAVLTVTPSPTVFFGKMTTADKKEQSVTVTTPRGEPFKLTLGQESVQEPVKLEYTAKNPDAEGRAAEWEIHVALGPNTEIGMRNYPINFKSDIPVAHPKYPAPDGSTQYHGFMLNVQAQVTGMVSAEPSFITFGMVRPGEPIERTLRIECHDDFQLKADMPVAFEGLQGQDFPFKDVFKVTVVPTEDAKAADVKVLLQGLPQDLNGSFGGVLKIKVGHPFMDELLVRFSGVCRPGLPSPAPAGGGQAPTNGGQGQ